MIVAYVGRGPDHAVRMARFEGSEHGYNLVRVVAWQFFQQQGVARIRGGLQQSVSKDDTGRWWARRVTSDEEVPADFRAFFRTISADELTPFPYCALTPTFRGIYRDPEPEKLVLLTSRRLYVAEATKAGVRGYGYPLDGVLTLEHGIVLLYSWIRIQAHRDDGGIGELEFKFNSVTDRIMNPFIDALRAPPFGRAGPRNGERPSLSYLALANVKFRNYARASLRPGDRLRLSLYQSEIRRTVVGLGRLHLSRHLSAAHLVLVTDSELVVICDDEGQHLHRGAPYGAIRTYVPLERITEASIAPMASGVLALEISIQGATGLRILFEPAKKRRLAQLVSKFER